MEELLQRAKNGDNQAVTEIMQSYKGLVLSVANRFYLVCGTKDDLLQEGMIGIYNAIKNFDENKGTFPAFVELCVRSQIKTAVTKSLTDKNLPLNDYVDIATLVDVDGGQNPLDDVLEKEKFDKLFELVSTQLTEREQNVIKLFVQYYSYGEIATALGLSYKSVDGALQSARKKLFKVLKPKEQQK